MSLKTKKSSSWIKEIVSFFRPKKVRVKKLISLPGKHHDLKKLFQEINLIYFTNSLTLAVDWNGRGSTKAQRVVRLGYYNPKTTEIKISRLLDKPHIPEYFVSYIIYHEILHHIYPPFRKTTGRRSIHHTEFLKKEREFKQYEEAQQFLSKLKETLFKI